MYRTIPLFCFILIASLLPAQSNLLPSIGVNALPADTTQVDPFSFYIDSTDLFLQSGYQAGDIVPDFTFYDTASQTHSLSAILSDGKPLVLVTVSLTCPGSRSGMETVYPQLYNSFGNQVNFLFVYTLEAHPMGPDLCPFSGTVNTTSANLQDSILFPQPNRYGYRKNMAGRFIQRYDSIPFALAIDGPANEYWNHFGPAPNNAYLIAPSGMVYRKYGWFSRSRLELTGDIPALLNSLGTAEAPVPLLTSLYPNPSGGDVYLHTNTRGPWSLFIYDAQGRIVSSRPNIQEQDISFSEAELPAGIWFFEIVYGDEMNTIRLARN